MLTTELPANYLNARFERWSGVWEPCSREDRTIAGTIWRHVGGSGVFVAGDAQLTPDGVRWVPFKQCDSPDGATIAEQEADFTRRYFAYHASQQAGELVL